jgi:hypothetical protein
MFTIIWNTNWFHVVEVLLKDTKFNSDYIVTSILELLYETFYPHGKRLPKQKLLLHLDNAHSHDSKQTQKYIEKNSFTSISHPPYSHDIAPYDFYLFENVKYKLTDHGFDSVDELKQSLC